MLSYSDLESAADLLRETFRSWPPHLTDAPAEPAAGPPMRPRPSKTEGARTKAPKGRYMRSSAVTLNAVDDEVFLIDARNPRIFHLNAVGTGLWNLLSEPASLAEAVEVFEAAFPEQPPGAVASDLAALFRDLAAASLIEPAGQ
jgi:hypothetical protein